MNFSKLGSYFSRTDFLRISGQVITLGTHRGSEAACAFIRGGFRGQSPAAWRFPLVLPTTYHSPFFFFATAQALGKGFWKNGVNEMMAPTGCFTIPVLDAGMPITGETERTDSTKGDFGSVERNRRGVLLWAGRREVTGLSALPTCWSQ